MASSSSKSSSSPILSRINPAAVVRNSESSDPVRKSFAVNPLVKPSITANSRGLNPKTPANSPLDYHRRSTTGSRDFDEKENGKDHNPKPSRLRSPTLANGAKNFMSPTISASSKKKILAEKNEPIRTSLSISDLKSSSIDWVNPHESPIQETSFDQKPTDFSSSDATSDLTDLRPAFQVSSSTPKPSKSVTFSDCVTENSSNPAFDNADAVTISSAPSNPSPKSFPTLAPLDADPSMPPYDSKTNYLSPRPRFLLYRPNPRIERYLNKEEARTRLEEIFLSESLSDSEVTEETQSSDEVTSDEFAEKVEQEMDEEEKNSPPEPSDLIGKDAGVENSAAKGNCKSFNLYKLTALILLLCFGCSSILYSTPQVRNNHPSEIYQFAKLSYPKLAENFWVLPKNVAAYARGVIMNFGEERRLVHPVHYFNLTALREDISIDGNFVFDQSLERIKSFLSEPTTEIESRSLEEENELLKENFELGEAEEDYSEIIMEDSEPSFEEQEQPESELHERLEEFSGEKGDPKSQVVEMSNSLQVKDEIQPLEPVRVEEAEEESFKLAEEELSVENGAVEMNHNSEVKDEKLPLKPVGVEEVEEESSETLSMAAFSNVNQQVIPVILLLPLMAAAVYFYSRRVKAISSDAKESKSKDLNSRKDHYLEHVVEESCPSELSSFQKNSSNGSKRTRGAGSNKAQSQEMILRKNGRRESVSSSLDYSISTDSPSYGSFTAYKKLATKHNNCEEGRNSSSAIEQDKNQVRFMTINP